MSFSLSLSDTLSIFRKEKERKREGQGHAPGVLLGCLWGAPGASPSLSSPFSLSLSAPGGPGCSWCLPPLSPLPSLISLFFLPNAQAPGVPPGVLLEALSQPITFGELGELSKHVKVEVEQKAWWALRQKKCVRGHALSG